MGDRPGGCRRPRLLDQGWVGSDSNRRASRVPRMRTVPLTSLPGQQRAPTFSPDGNQVAFAWDGETGNDDIYVQLVGAGTPLRLTTDPASDRNPAWSPDGRFIAFIRFSPPESGISSSPPSVVPSAGSPASTGRTTGTCTVRVSAGLPTEGSWPSPTVVRRKSPGACSCYPSTVRYDANSRFRHPGTFAMWHPRSRLMVTLSPSSGSRAAG